MATHTAYRLTLFAASVCITKTQGDCSVQSGMHWRLWSCAKSGMHLLASLNAQVKDEVAVCRVPQDQDAHIVAAENV